jgi:hypothetical protein
MSGGLFAVQTNARSQVVAVFGLSNLMKGMIANAGNLRYDI